MSGIVNSTLKLCNNLGLRLLLASNRNFHLSSASYLYSHSALGIDNYLQTRKKVKEQFAHLDDKFRAKMTDFVNDKKNLIFTEDLKNMVNLAEPTDLDLIRDMIKKFNTQTSEFRFGSFVFGPVVMRMFYFLDAPDYALKCFEDPFNDGFFDQLISYQILLDLLYNHQRYDDMYHVFEKIKEKQLNMSKFPKYSVVLVLAACYKQNTPQSFEYATKLWNEMINVGTMPLRRAVTLFAALALNQGKPQAALESIATQRPHYVTIRNIKAIALSEVDRIDDALLVLKAVLDVDQPGASKNTFFENTETGVLATVKHNCLTTITIIEKVKESVQKSNNKDWQKEFEDIEKALRDRGLIDKQTLDQLLTSEIQIVNKKTDSLRGMPNTYQKKRQFPNNRQRDRLQLE